jgi:hypothetical protein
VCVCVCRGQFGTPLLQLLLRVFLADPCNWIGSNVDITRSFRDRQLDTKAPKVAASLKALVSLLCDRLRSGGYDGTLRDGLGDTALDLMRYVGVFDEWANELILALVHCTDVNAALRISSHHLASSLQHGPIVASK